jgi:hypothetical protein
MNNDSFNLNYTISHPVEKIISLGNWCSTKANINLYLNPDIDWKNTVEGNAHIFDWMCIGDYEYLIKALNNNLQDIFCKEDLVVLDNVLTENGQAVLINAIYNLKYKMIWPHLFDKLSDFSLGEDINKINDSETIKKLYSKFQYLSNKFINAKDKTVLYIITFDYHIHIPENIRPIKPSKETIISLRDALTRIRGNTNFILLFISKNQPFYVYENIIFCNNVDSHGFYENKLSTSIEQILSLLKIKIL